ncbi:NADH:flavin oxidoreductase [Fusobacterium animalis ATCC 51191]|uniref:NADH:flavin oxidoreductase n=1 Tax=Fusobacterium animalis ATCC 51191 TaxID=997347 RepID=F9EMM3_9FUSO|nr:NADH:flavin oxidoreductase [Fusobacterium animalis ATCC 51191]
MRSDIMSNIFSQIKVKDVNFSNRIVMAPMVHFGYKNKNGNMEEKLLNIYLNYADKG